MILTISIIKNQFMEFSASYLPGPGVSIVFQKEFVKRASLSKTRDPLFLKLESTYPEFTIDFSYS